MKQHTKILMITALVLSNMTVAHANIYVGAKASTFTDESLKLANLDITSKSKLGYNLFAGVKMDNNLGLEVDYTGDGTVLDIPREILDSTLDAVFKVKDPKITGRWQYGAYATYHFSPSNQPDFFVKGKLGYVHGVVELNEEKEFKEDGLGLGMGLGYRLGEHSFVELSYEHSDVENTQSKLGLGLAYVF